VKRDRSLDWMRAVLTLLVIIGHCTFISIKTNFGGIDYQEPLLSLGGHLSITQYILTFIKDVIYKFHMPAFFALSGILYGRQYRIGKNNSLSRLFKSKLKRLILPYFICWLLWNIPLKYYSNYYLPIQNDCKKMLWQMINPYQVHLWYLSSLFFVFLIICFVAKYTKDATPRLIICKR
jgi:fucose 4-O-acetylase-like acetyltransferase